MLDFIEIVKFSSFVVVVGGNDSNYVRLTCRVSLLFEFQGKQEASGLELLEDVCLDDTNSTYFYTFRCVLIFINLVYVASRGYKIRCGLDEYLS